MLLLTSASMYAVARQEKIPSTPEEYDLVIISYPAFAEQLQPLVNHKYNHSVQTKLVLLQQVYGHFPGRDEAEQIKYFIKHAIEEWHISYILLVGDITKVPIRATAAYPWNGFGNNILSDLYYADIYDENGSFCSWDANDNDIFGEVVYEFNRFPPTMDDVDEVNLYPDIHVGRLACRTSDEVDTVVDKIITYENSAYNQIWFNKIILAGGDTFPPGKGSSFFVYEGEITNKKVAQQLPEFEKVFLWSSKRNLNAFTFNREISKGAGFVSYAGHGFEHGWGTYRPNALRGKMGFTHPLYYIPLVKFLHNGYKLPLIFFDACLTAKLDFNISDLENYYPNSPLILRLLTGKAYDPSEYFTCFAWSFLIQKQGGAIATIGATRPAYTFVDEDGVYGGAGYLDVQFFKAYEEGITVGEMFTQAQINYLDYVGKDYFTIEEYLLLGDPSLRVGGYP